MRGEHQYCPLAKASVCGIIPACAGSTALAALFPQAGIGSSPHARVAPIETPTL